MERVLVGCNSQVQQQSLSEEKSFEYRQAHYECYKEAHLVGSNNYITAPIAQARAIDRLYKACMQAKGY